jgi:dihydrofolate reductase
MRELVYLINITPDGFCDHTAVAADDELHRYSTNLLKKADLVLFGRVTFQLFESYWPAVVKHSSGTDSENEFAQTIDAIDKIVFSKTLKKTSWKNTGIISNQNLEEEISKLKDMAGRNICIFGSPCLAQSLIKHGLIDEYHFCLQPVIAGHGKRFFENEIMEKRIDLKLFKTQAFSSGAVARCYRPHYAEH